MVIMLKLPSCCRAFTWDLSNALLGWGQTQNRNSMRRIPTCLVLILSSFQAPAQLLPTRSIGVFGYQTLEPLGFNSSYSGIVDEWGSLPLPVMNLALNNCGINERIWRPTRSVLDGHYLLTGQVEIENIAKKSRDSGETNSRT
jgi:hypothetical protein